MADYSEREYLSRKEAAAYLTQHWFPIAASTLATKAQDGSGPQYRLTAQNGGRALYRRADLDNWAQKAPQAPRQAARSA